MIEGVTGHFFRQQTAAALAVAVAATRTDRYNPAVIRRHAEGFSREVFLARMRRVIEQTSQDASCISHELER
jgi:hypothetical protein